MEALLPSFFPSSLTHLTFKLMDQLVCLPASLLYLSIEPFGGKKVTELMLNNLPPSLTYLSIKEPITYNSHIVIHSLPPKLTHLHVLDSFNNLILPPLLPSSLTHLTTPHLIDHSHTSTLTSLIFLGHFNASIDHLPPSLKRLRLGVQFNHPINNLPVSLTHLTVGYSFDQPMNSLPPTLLHLKITSCTFNQPIDQLPTSLSTLNICSSVFNQPITLLPSSLSSLIILSRVFTHTVESLPPLSLLQLYISASSSFSPLPTTITRLILGKSFNLPLSVLPTSLYILIIGKKFNHPFLLLPFYMDKLVLKNSRYSHPISLPPFLSHLRIGTSPITLPPHNGNHYTNMRRYISENKWYTAIDEST